MTNNLTSELSERELEILKLLATGASNKDIARQLVISPNTVKVHLRNIFSKTGASSRTEATLFAIQHGMALLDIPESVSSQSVGDGLQANIDGVSPSGSVESQDWLAGLVTTTKPFENPRPLTSRIRWVWIGITVILILGLVTGVALALKSINSPQVPPAANQAELNIQLPARWKTIASLPEARKGLAVVPYEGNIYVIGGAASQSVSARVDRYDPAQNTWVQLAPKPVPVTDISAAILGEKIFVPGGKQANGMPTDLVEVFDPRRDTWERAASLPVPISAYALASFEGRLYLFGGWDGKNYLSNIFEYDPELDKWSLRTPMSAPRAFAGAAVVDSKIFIIGGFDGTRALTTNEAYYPQRDQDGSDPWETHAALPVGRYAMGITSLADSIYLVGGQDSAGMDNEQYSPQADRWTAFENSPSPIGSGAGLAALENKLYVLGGEKSGKLVTDNQIYQAIYTQLIPLIQK